MRYLESLAQGWPHISYLADFMKVTTAPPKQKFLNDQDRRERGSRTKVAMLTFESNTPVQRVDFSDIQNLSNALNEPRNSHDDVHARLFVVEDLSRDVIEALGARFDVDPLFFRGHISDYMVRIFMLLFKPAESPQTLPRDFRLSPESCKLTWRNTTVAQPPRSVGRASRPGYYVAQAFVFAHPLCPDQILQKRGQSKKG